MCVLVHVCCSEHIHVRCREHMRVCCSEHVCERCKEHMCVCCRYPKSAIALVRWWLLVTCPLFSFYLQLRQRQLGDLCQAAHGCHEVSEGGTLQTRGWQEHVKGGLVGRRCVHVCVRVCARVYTGRSVDWPETSSGKRS